MLARNFSITLKQFQKCFINSCRFKSKKAVQLKTCYKGDKINITITGVNSRVGEATAFLLKQEKEIEKITLFDIKTCRSVADHLTPITTNSIVDYCYGMKMLPRAIEDATIVVICGGLQSFSNIPEDQLFRNNADYVRQVVMHVAEFNPICHIVIASPPVACMVPMAVEECKKSELYNADRIYGMVTINCMRSRSLAAETLNVSPESLPKIEVVGGSQRRSFVPILSPITKLTPVLNEILTRNIQEVEEDLLYYQEDNENIMTCDFSVAVATARFTMSLAKALSGCDVSECAFVKQFPPLNKKVKYMSSNVKLGPTGIVGTSIPPLSKKEMYRLKMALEMIEDSIYYGKSYITGEDRHIDKVICVPPIKYKREYILSCFRRDKDVCDQRNVECDAPKLIISTIEKEKEDKEKEEKKIEEEEKILKNKRAIKK